MHLNIARVLHTCPDFLALQVADMLVAAKTDDVCILDVSTLCSFTEHMVLANSRPPRHNHAAAQAVANQVCQEQLIPQWHGMVCILVFIRTTVLCIHAILTETGIHIEVLQAKLSHSIFCLLCNPANY